MRVLLDECINPRLAGLLTELGHEVTTVAHIGQRAQKDGALLLFAQGLIDVFLTLDRGLGHQHNRAYLTFGIVIVRVRRNTTEHYQPMLTMLDAAIRAVRPGELREVVSPALS